MARDDARGGTPKKPKPKKSGKRKVAVRSKAATPNANMLKVVPVEEADGFQIFRPDKSRKKPARPKASRRDTEVAGAPARSAGIAHAARDDAPRVPDAAGQGQRPDDMVARWMANTISAIVHEEMQQAVARITRSVIQGKPAKASPRN